MKLPWDQKYIKVSFHVIFTLIIFYILKRLVDGAFFTFANMHMAFDGVGSFFSGLFSIFSPLFIGLIFAYLFDPIVDFFQKHFLKFFEKYMKPRLIRYKYFRNRQKKARLSKYKTRVAGTALTYLAILFVIWVIGYFLFKKLGGNNGAFFDNVVSSVMKTSKEFSEKYEEIQIKLEEWGLLEYISDYLSEFINSLTQFVTNFATAFVASMKSAGGGIVNFLIGIVIAFYFLSGKEAHQAKVIEIMDAFIPTKINNFIKSFLHIINEVFSGYIRGQLTDALIMAVLISTWLTIIKVDFAIIIGIFSGFSNLIPYFGAIIGLLLSVLAALLSGEPIQAVYAAVGILVLQQIDGIFIVPKIVGESVELSPVLVLLSLAVASELFGIPGMILAVPTCAVLKIFLYKIMKRLKAAAARQ